MTTAKVDQKEKLLIEYCISDRSLFIKVFHLLQPNYFEKPLDQVIKLVSEYFEQYHNLPTPDIIAAETGLELVSRDFAEGEYDYALEEIEEHCQNEAMRQAILHSADLLHENRFSAIFDAIREALQVKMDKNLGTNLFEDPQTRLTAMQQNLDTRPIGIQKLDELLDNVRRGELGIFAAGTGGGKSICLSNIAHYMGQQNLDVLILSLELNEELTSKRLDSITTGISTDEVFNRIGDVVKIHQKNLPNYGNITIKKMRSDASPSVIRTYLMEYHLVYGKYPDVLCLDYIDILKPDNRHLQGKFDIDEHLTFSVRDIMIDYDMYGFTASQLNRDAADRVDIHYGMIAGGISKVNASDFTVAIFASESDIDNGIINIKQLKVRNTKKNAQPIQLYLNPDTLLITDQPQQIVSKGSNPLASKPGKGTSEQSGISELKNRLANL